MTDVVVVGSINLDAVASVERLPLAGETVLAAGFGWVPGGKGANQAVAAARQGASVAMVGRVGADEGGRALHARLAGEGVDVTSVPTDPDQPTGLALIAVDPAGTNTIVVVPGANGALTPDDVDSAAELIEQAVVVVCQLEIPLPAVVRAFELARAAGGTTILNPSPARALDASVLRLVDVLVANEHEASCVGDTSLCRVVVTTLGERGATFTEAGHTTSILSPKVVAVDTTGAGDAFCGALAAGLSQGRPLTEVIRSAVVAGALAVTRSGALPSLPTEAEVARLLADK